MAEYLIRDTTLTAIADAIRAKTGRTDAIPVSSMAEEIGAISAETVLEDLPISLDFSSGDMPLNAPDGALVKSAVIQKPETLVPENIADGVQIAGIVGTHQGGGSSEDVRYVTFVSEDGTVEYGKKAVAVGDDCADPIARGVFDTPTKESDAQYNYTFAGWATEAGGGMVSDALKAVTEDKTMYANFAAVVRYYTITYYDSDGITKLKTESVAYGAMPTSFIPEKAGVSFVGWVPDLAIVTGDTSYVAEWQEKVTFSGGAWADIVAICEAGQAEEYFAVGDTREETIGDVTTTLIILDFNHDELADGTGKASMTIWAKTAPTNTTAAPTSWETLASFMKSTIKPLLPADLRSAIKPVVKQCDVTGADIGTPVNVTFELFPLSFVECAIKAYGARKYTDDTWTAFATPLGTAYQYFSDNYNSTWYGPSNVWTGSSYNYWMRQWFTTTSSSSYVYTYKALSTTSKKYADYATTTTEKHPVMLAFCI